MDGHLGSFYVLATVNSAANNNGILETLSILVSSGYMPRSGMPGHMVALFLVFKESLPSSIVGVSIYLSMDI